MFIKDQDDAVVMLAVWVDDIVIASSSVDARLKFVEELRSRFPIEESDTLDWILGMKVVHDRKNKRLTVSQTLYVDDLLQKYAPFLNDSCKSFDVPMADTPILTTDMCPEIGSVEHEQIKGRQTFYMKVVGRMLWLNKYKEN